MGPTALESQVFIFPVHYDNERAYEGLKEEARLKHPDPDSPFARRDAEGTFPVWFYNDIAGFVELRVKGRDLRFTIYGARSYTSPGKWRKDRRLKGRYLWSDGGHWSLQRCRTRVEYADAVEDCLQAIRKRMIPAKFEFDWTDWRPLLRSTDWARLTRET